MGFMRPFALTSALATRPKGRVVQRTCLGHPCLIQKPSASNNSLWLTLCLRPLDPFGHEGMGRIAEALKTAASRTSTGWGGLFPIENGVLRPSWSLDS